MRPILLFLLFCGSTIALLGIAPPATGTSEPIPLPGDEPANPVASSDTPAPDQPDATGSGTPGVTRDTRPLIQFAICLDTSGSMKGLLDSARQKLWSITNELALADPAPRLEVALLTFGNDGHNAERGWVAKHLDFTEDLDSVSELLFSFVTNGGTELVGRVLQAADQELSWDDSDRTLRLVFVAGNESADQDGQVPFRDISAKLISRDISVSSVYCGNPEDAIAPGWREVALRGDGHFASIDQDQGTLMIETPYDARLTALSEKINTTYVPYGSTGIRGAENQWVQDNNAVGLNPDAAASRATCKATSNYFCSWDLVDLLREKRIEVTKIVITDLPEDLQKMTIEEVCAHVEKLQTERTAIQTKITALSEKRQAFIQEEMAKRHLTEENAFDTAVRRALREKARGKGLTFPGDAAEPTNETTPAKGVEVLQGEKKDDGGLANSGR